jgi:hypothetical protein
MINIPGGKKSKNGSSINKRYWPDALTNPQFTAGKLPPKISKVPFDNFQLRIELPPVFQYVP